MRSKKKKQSTKLYHWKKNKLKLFIVQDMNDELKDEIFETEEFLQQVKTKNEIKELNIKLHRLLNSYDVSLRMN